MSSAAEMESDETAGRLRGRPKAVDLEVSSSYYNRAQNVLPGGTTRVTVKRMPVPIYAHYGRGAHLYDVDGNRYLDLVGNYTTLIHGHAFQPVVDAITAHAGAGTCFANPTDTEIGLAELLVERVPGLERLRFANSGTEAVMFAIKGARGFTGRSKIAKLEGAYHGAYDWAEVSEASGPENWGGAESNSVPYYKGMPHSVLDETIVLPINNVERAVALVERNARDLSCVVVDMMPSRAGLVPLEPEFVAALREVTHRLGVVLISDEVLNFRAGYAGISDLYGVKPDLLTFGKIIGGGLPVGAFGGRADIMEVFDSSRGAPAVPHGGTFAANPLTMVAGMAAMKALTQESFAKLDALGEQTRAGLRGFAEKRSLPISVTGLGSLFRVHLRAQAPRDYRQAWVTPEGAKLHKEIADRLLAYGVLMPSDTSSCLSLPMTPADISAFIESFAAVLDDLPDAEQRIRQAAANRPHEHQY
ncbi:aspartate aminotransferase family protein [Roseibium sp. M-1]